MSSASYKIVIGGDLFPSYKNEELFIQGAIDGLYDKEIVELFRSADFSICNLEGALTEENVPIKKCDPIIKAPIAAIKGIKALGVKCVTLANNHVVDYGMKGYEDTCAILESNNILHFGSGKNEKEITTHYTLGVGDKTIVFYTVAETMFNIPKEDYPGVNIYDEYRVCNEIKQLKGKGDYLIVLYHGGTEFFWYNSKLMRKRFHRMADNGADVIIAQHTHCIGIKENYSDSYLLYGQGDFLFARSVNEYKETGLLLELNIGKDSLEIKEHLVRHEGGKVLYDKTQNMDVFIERSKKFAQGEEFVQEYRVFSDEKIVMFLQAFRGKNLVDRIIRKLFSREVYIKFLRSMYSEKQILRMISAIQFEEYSESVIQGLWNMLEERE